MNNIRDDQPADDQPLGVSAKKAAELLDLSVRTLDALTESGRLRCVRIGTGPKAQRRYAITELQRFLAEG